MRSEDINRLEKLTRTLEWSERYALTEMSQFYSELILDLIQAAIDRSQITTLLNYPEATD